MAAANQPALQPPAPGRVGAAIGRYLLAFALLPNLPFWLLAPRLGIVTPGVFNLDVLLLGVLWPYVAPGWLILLYCGDLLLEVGYGIRATYGTTYVEIFYTLRQGSAIVPWSQWLAGVGAVLGIVAVTGVVWLLWRPRLRSRQRRGWALILLAILIPLALFTQRQRQRATARVRAGWARGQITADPLAPSLGNIASSTLNSPALALYHGWREEHIWAWLHGAYSQTVPAANASSQAVAALTPQPDRPNLVLVLTESWGLADELALRQALQAPFATPSLQARYRLERGTVAFAGSTAAGELRELCQDRLADSLAPLSVAGQVLAQCLPWKLRHTGYDTLAVDSDMRFWPGGARWYQLLGFGQVIGFNDLHGLGLPTFLAGPFRSIRDPEVAAWMAQQLLQPHARPRMIFWLTMSAHLPVHEPLPAGYGANCGVAAVTRQFADACGWYQVELRTLSAIAAAAATPHLPPTVFLVVGDHAPPFLDGARHYFSPALVPYALLTPRAALPATPTHAPR